MNTQLLLGALAALRYAFDPRPGCSHDRSGEHHEHVTHAAGTCQQLAESAHDVLRADGHLPGDAGLALGRQRVLHR